MTLATSLPSRDPNPTDESVPLLHSLYYERNEVLAMDLKFKRAMLKAQRAGLEHFVCGVVVDRSPLVPKRFEKQPRFSPSASPAASCADG